jgi:hypothetical protein
MLRKDETRTKKQKKGKKRIESGYGKVEARGHVVSLSMVSCMRRSQVAVSAARLG